MINPPPIPTMWAWLALEPDGQWDIASVLMPSGMIPLVAKREDVARQMLPLAARHAASIGRPVQLHCWVEGQALDLIHPP